MLFMLANNRWHRYRVPILLALTISLLLVAGSGTARRNPGAGSAYAQIGVVPTVTMTTAGGRSATAITDLEIDRLSGFGTRSEAIQYSLTTREGNLLITSVPGGVKRPAFQVVRKCDSHLQLWSWRRQLEKYGLSARQSGDLSVWNSEAVLVEQWTFTNAWPSQYEVTWDGGVAYETVSFMCDDIRRVK